MRVVLIYPPLADPAQPYPALPALAAYLRMQGEHEPIQWDANIGYVRSVLTHDRLAEAAQTVEARLEQFHQQPEGFQESKDEYIALVAAALKAPFVVAGIDAAVKDLQGWACYRDLGRLDRGRRLVQEALAVLAAASFPLGLTFFNTPVKALAAPETLLRWAADEERNPFRDYFAASVLPGLVASAPGAIGISISFRGQALGAATLALMIRRALPGVPIILGGNLVSAWQDRWQDLEALFDWCDYLIPFEGETALNALLTALASGAALDGVPNLIYRQDGKLRRTPLATEDLDCLPAPDYAGLPLGLYLAPDTVFSLYTSRGCYWGKCGFCAVSPAMRLGHRRRSAARIRDDIRTIGETYGGRYVTFADDCVAPAALRQIADAVGESGREIVWQAEVRFEPALTGELLQKLRSAGCMNLIFGFESSSRRVRGLMGKGTADEEIERILAACRRAGIAFNLQFFFGFPGERPDEADETVAFVLQQAHGAATFSFGTFELQRGSEAERAPEAYGISQVDRAVGPLAVRFDYEPLPPHAAAVRERLHRLLAERMTYVHTGLSMNAQTLFVLDVCGPEGLAALYRPPACGAERDAPHAEAADLMAMRLAQSPSLHAGLFLPLDASDLTSTGQELTDGRQMLVYDYDQDATVAVSPVATWLLQQSDGSRPLAEILASLPEDTADLAETLVSVSGELYRRRFLVPQKEQPPAQGDEPCPD